LQALKPYGEVDIGPGIEFKFIRTNSDQMKGGVKAQVPFLDNINFSIGARAQSQDEIAWSQQHYATLNVSGEHTNTLVLHAKKNPKTDGVGVPGILDFGTLLKLNSSNTAFGAKLNVIVDASENRMKREESVSNFVLHLQCSSKVLSQRMEFNL
jgi:hypothetical protein